MAISLALSRHWGIAQDTPLIHYVVFLAGHGFSPYRDIIEMNMPGAYMTEWVVMSGLGSGDAAWRFYDMTLMAIAALSASAILRPAGRFASFFGAALITIYHLGQGPSDVGQRDYALAVFLLVACAFLFHILRSGSSPARIALCALAFAASLGWAATIKPTVVPFAVILLFAGVAILWQSGRTITPFLVGSLIGALLSTLAVIVFLIHYHATSAFLELLRTLMPYHRGNGNLPLVKLSLLWLPKMFYPTASLLVALVFFQRRELKWPQFLLLLGACFGVATFIYQGKGWSYHAAPAMLFLLTLVTMLAFTSRRPTVPVIALVLCAFIPGAYTPIQIWRHGRELDRRFQDSLGASLNALSAPYAAGSLSGEVQCLDWNAGCIDVLYRKQIVQATGFIYDFYLFPANPAPVTAELQQRFLSTLNQHPPRVVILTSHDWPAMQGFAKLDRWPEFHQWLDSHYLLYTEQHPTSRGYRIYTLRQ